MVEKYANEYRWLVLSCRYEWKNHWHLLWECNAMAQTRTKTCGSTPCAALRLSAAPGWGTPFVTVRQVAGRCTPAPRRAASIVIHGSAHARATQPTPNAVDCVYECSLFRYAPHMQGIVLHLMITSFPTKLTR
jgi:hypothetical protein